MAHLSRPFPTIYERPATPQQPWISIPRHDPLDGKLGSVDVKLKLKLVRRIFKATAEAGGGVGALTYDGKDTGMQLKLLSPWGTQLGDVQVRFPEKRIDGIAPGGTEVRDTTQLVSETWIPFIIPVTHPEEWTLAGGAGEVVLTTPPRIALNPPIIRSGKVRPWADLWWELAVIVIYGP